MTMHPRLMGAGDNTAQSRGDCESQADGVLHSSADSLSRLPTETYNVH